MQYLSLPLSLSPPSETVNVDVTGLGPKVPARLMRECFSRTCICTLRSVRSFESAAVEKLCDEPGVGGGELGGCVLCFERGGGGVVGAALVLWGEGVGCGEAA